jgi:hypothetical protein
VTIFAGTTNVTAQWALTKVDSLGLTSSLNGSTITVTEMQAAYAAGYVDITASKAGSSNITKRFSLAKTRSGTDGGQGSDGARGSLTLYASGSSWSDTTANNAIVNATGSGTRRIGDTVTISNGSTFAATRYWSGGSWVNPGVVIDGNLLVRGTISADALYGGVLGGITIRMGSGSTPSGNAFEVSSSGVFWVDNIVGGVLWGNNNDYPSSAAVQAVTDSSSPGLLATVPSYNSSGAACVRANNHASGSAGVIANATYDFYAMGTGINGPFTGAHDALIPNDALFEVGDLVVDVECVGTRGFSDTIFTVERSSQPYQRGVRGPISVIAGPLRDHAPASMMEGRSVYLDANNQESTLPVMSGAYYDMADTHTLVAMNSLGEGQVKVCGEGGAIGPDDLLVASSIPGVAMRQADDIVRSYTVAKARVNKGGVIDFDNDQQIKILPCIYLGG